MLLFFSQRTTSTSIAFDVLRGTCELSGNKIFVGFGSLGWGLNSDSGCHSRSSETGGIERSGAIGSLFDLAVLAGAECSYTNSRKARLAKPVNCSTLFLVFDPPSTLPIQKRTNSSVGALYSSAKRCLISRVYLSSSALLMMVSVLKLALVNFCSSSTSGPFRILDRSNSRKGFSSRAFDFYGGIMVECSYHSVNGPTAIRLGFCPDGSSIEPIAAAQASGRSTCTRLAPLRALQQENPVDDIWL